MFLGCSGGVLLVKHEVLVAIRHANTPGFSRMYYKCLRTVLTPPKSGLMATNMLVSYVGWRNSTTKNKGCKDMSTNHMFRLHKNRHSPSWKNRHHEKNCFSNKAFLSKWRVKTARRVMPRFSCFQSCHSSSSASFHSSSSHSSSHSSSSPSSSCPEPEEKKTQQ